MKTFEKRGGGRMPEILFCRASANFHQEVMHARSATSQAQSCGLVVDDACVIERIMMHCERCCVVGCVNPSILPSVVVLVLQWCGFVLCWLLFELVFVPYGVHASESRLG